MCLSLYWYDFEALTFLLGASVTFDAYSINYLLTSCNCVSFAHSSLAYLVVKMCDESSSSDSEGLQSQEKVKYEYFASFNHKFTNFIFKKKSQIDVKADVYAEMNSEPISYSQNSAHSIPSLRPKNLRKENCCDFDEIFSIRDDISWKIVVKDIDYYRIKEEKPQTSESSDDNEQDVIFKCFRFSEILLYC